MTAKLTIKNDGPGAIQALDVGEVNINASYVITAGKSVSVTLENKRRLVIDEAVIPEIPAVAPSAAAAGGADSGP